VAKFHGIDVAEEAILRATELAKSEGLDITYEKGDLNKLVLEENAYDLVVTQNCLHHILRLEHLADQILKSMRPGGVLWIHDLLANLSFNTQVFLERFDVIEKFEWNTVEKYVCPTGCRSAYVENEDIKVIFDLIAAVDKMLLEEGVLKPCTGQYLC
jgi:SAM-dependent methyltransferase